MISRDGFSRPIDYLRVSVTDRCNLRCVYCMPEDGVELMQHRDVLRYEEIVRIVRVAAALGIGRVRLTGGEPLARAGLADLVGMISKVPGIDDLSMTTNGTLLARHAQALADAGLDRVNVSLDTLDAKRFREITRGGELRDALNGIAAAERAGLDPIKINVVVMRGLNDDELGDFARMTLEHAWHVRFIEIMPIGLGEHWSADGFIPSSEILSRLESKVGPLEPAAIEGAGPAEYWRIPGAPGTLGVISAVSDHFCASCNRLRLTADGRLIPCLFSGSEIDLRTPLRSGTDDDLIAETLRRAIAAKPAGHRLAEHLLPEGRLMSETGG